MPGFFRALLVLIAVLPGLMTAQRIWAAFPGSIVTPNNSTVLQDYIIMWVSGRTALAGHTPLLFTTASFNEQIATLLQPGLDMVYWVYPPTMILLSTPLALLPPLPSMAVWTALTLGLLWAGLRLTKLPLSTRAAVACSPAVLETVFDGQNGSLMTACAIGAITQAQRRPWLAGLCMSVAVLKPQMAIVAPVCVLAAWRWRAILWAGLFASAWMGLAALCFRPSVWVDYFTQVLPTARYVFLGFDKVPFGTLYMQELMVTPFAAFRAAGCGVVLAQLLQVAATALVLGLLGYHAFRARRDGAPPPLALALASVPLVTPYAMTYDMIGPTAAAAMLLQARPANVLRGVAIAAWVWPGLALYAGLFLQPGLGSVVFAGLLVAILVHARRGRTAPAVSEPASPPPSPHATAQWSPAT